MSYYIRSLEQARAIITAYERCSSCDAMRAKQINL